MDPELQEVFNLVVRSGINVFDTADSYGTGRLNGERHTWLQRARVLHTCWTIHPLNLAQLGLHGTQ